MRDTASQWLWALISLAGALTAILRFYPHSYTVSPKHREGHSLPYRYPGLFCWVRTSGQGLCSCTVVQNDCMLREADVAWV